MGTKKHTAPAAKHRIADTGPDNDCDMLPGQFELAPAAGVVPYGVHYCSAHFLRHVLPSTGAKILSPPDRHNANAVERRAIDQDRISIFAAAMALALVIVGMVALHQRWVPF